MYLDGVKENRPDLKNSPAKPGTLRGDEARLEVACMAMTKASAPARRRHEDRGEELPPGGVAPNYSKAAAPAVLSFSNCEIATINCDMTKGFSSMILLGTPCEAQSGAPSPLM